MNTPDPMPSPNPHPDPNRDPNPDPIPNPNPNPNPNQVNKPQSSESLDKHCLKKKWCVLYSASCCLVITPDPSPSPHPDQVRAHHDGGL